MDYRHIRGYENYILYENGDVYNTNTNKKLKVNFSNNQYHISFCKNSKQKSFTYVRVIYEMFYNDTLTNNEIIQFIDKNSEEKFNYKNLKKINRTDIFKNVNHETLDIDKEWRMINNYDDYKISNYGDIFSIKRDRMLKPTKDIENNHRVKLMLNNKRISFCVHHLVYKVFNNMFDENKIIIEHIDGNKSNNYINNLREQEKNKKNVNYPLIIKTNKIHQFTLNNEFVKEWNSNSEICKELKYKTSAISNCCLEKIKTAYGFIWKNVNLIKNLDDYKIIKTNDGKTYSKYKINNKGHILDKNNILLKCINNKDNLIKLKADDNTYNTIKIHELVALAFLENPNNYKIINQIDRNIFNNNVENLEWSDKKNIIYKQAKKINQIHMTTNRIIKTFDTVSDAYRELNKIYGRNIQMACNGKRNSAFGYKWEFVN